MSTVHTLDVAADHPAYAGHFPGTPILPGVVLLDVALRQIARSTSMPAGQWQIAAAKFHRPAGPGDTLLLEHELLPDGSLRFSICTREATHPGRTVATGLLRPPLQVPVA